MIGLAGTRAHFAGDPVRRSPEHVLASKALGSCCAPSGLAPESILLGQKSSHVLSNRRHAMSVPVQQNGKPVLLTSKVASQTERGRIRGTSVIPNKVPRYT